MARRVSVKALRAQPPGRKAQQVATIIKRWPDCRKHVDREPETIQEQWEREHLISVVAHSLSGLHKRNFTTAAIAEAFGVDIAFVRKAVDRIGIPVKPPREQNMTVLRLRAMGLSYTKIGKETGLSDGAIARILKRHGKIGAYRT